MRQGQVNLCIRHATTAIVFESVKVLHQANNHIACFDEGVLLWKPVSLFIHYHKWTEVLTTETNTRPAIKRNILPGARATLNPSLRVEFFGVWAPDVLSAVHCVQTKRYHSALFNKYARFSVGPAADGERGVSECHAAVDGHWGEESEGYIHELAGD